MKTTSLIILLFLLTSNNILCQDSLSHEILKEYTLHFQINEDGSLSDLGKSFFEKEIKENQFIVLGEYHGSKSMSELTEAIIPIFKKNGGDFMALEIGPVSLEILKELNLRKGSLEDALYQFNTKYSYKKKSGTRTAIPFFSNVGDARFLSKAFEKDIRFIGLDQEFLYGYLPLIKKAYGNLPEKDKRIHKKKFHRVIDTLNHYYALEIESSFNEEQKKDFVVLFHNSKFVNSFLDALSVNEKNKKIVGAIKSSVEIYWNNSQGNYWLSNTLRTNNFIKNLRRGLISTGFQHSEDKMLVKIGGLHAAKGMNNYRMYDIGNTIFELARLNGNSSLHSVFLSRYYLNNGTMEDVLETDTWYSKNYKAFLQMGKKDTWTIIDLRPMRNLFYYKQKYLVNDIVKNYFDRYDIIIVAPTEESPVPNYKQ